MSIEKTEYGTFRARWVDATGTQRAKSFKKRAQAVEHLKDVAKDEAAGTTVDRGAAKMTVAEMADEWLDGALNLKVGSRETYERDLQRHILPVLGPLPLPKLTTKAIEKYLSDKKKTHKPSTVHRHYRTIRRLCQVAVERNKLTVNPCMPIKPPKVDSKEDLDTHIFLTVDEVDRLAAAIGARYRAWVLVCAYGGFRFAEMAGLRRRNVAPDGTSITVTEQMLKRRDGTYERDTPKSKRSRRVVTLPAFVAAELVVHMETWSQAGPDGFVFPNRNGGHMTTSFRGNTFKPAVRKAGLNPKLTPHNLRDTSASLSVRAGVHPKVIQQRLGHGSIKVTMDVYAGLFDDMDQGAANELDGLHERETKKDDETED